jgi:hypothetical protein
MRHFYVDVPNPKENNYDLNDRHITTDPEFREELKKKNDSNIDEFWSLPKLIPTKKRRKQQPLLDCTKNMILTSRDYIKRLKELLAKKNATTTTTQKNEKEASKEQRKLQREQQQKEKQDRTTQKTQKKKRRVMQQLTKRRRRGSADRDDTTEGASELPSTSDTPNAVQQGTNGLPSSQQAIPQ